MDRRSTTSQTAANGQKISTAADTPDNHTGKV
jgi:hypothetical protein